MLLLSSVLLPLMIQIAAFAALRITPFGDKSLVLGDADGYYINYLAYFSRVLSGNHGLLYSFSKGPGGSLSNLVSLFFFLRICGYLRWPAGIICPRYLLWL